MFNNFPAFHLFDLIAFLMFGALIFLLVLAASTRVRSWIRAWHRHGEPELVEELGTTGGFHLHEPDSALRRHFFHRIRPRTISWTGSQLVDAPPPREELHIGK